MDLKDFIYECNNQHQFDYCTSCALPVQQIDLGGGVFGCEHCKSPNSIEVIDVEKCGTGDNAFYCNGDYWDCECPDNKPYIHSKEKGNYCPVCKMFEEDGQPDSRANEIIDLYDPDKDPAIFKEYEE